MNYLVCPSCEQKALPVATRCPRCGRAFEGERIPVSSGRPRRSPTALGLLTAGVVVSLLAANSLTHRLNRAASPERPVISAPATAPAPRPLPPAPGPVATTSAARVRDSSAAVPVSAPVEPASAKHAAIAVIQLPAQDPVPPPSPEPMVLDSGKLRYASTWANVRAERSSAAEVVRVLHPGEGVEVDRLERGWYRISSDSDAVGYVDRRLLDASPDLAIP